MTDIHEPRDGGYVAVRYRSAPDGVLVYKRSDSAAAELGDPTARWFCLTEKFDRVLTWDALALTGPIAYVGEFVHRSAVNA